MLKKLFFKYAPDFLKERAMRIKKKQRNTQIKKQQITSTGFTKDYLIADFKKMGLKLGDAVLVHSSLSKIGFVVGAEKSVVDALLKIVGAEGTLLFPAYPAEGKNKPYLDKNLVFDSRNTSSKMGKITEYVRQLKGVSRSLHPTDSVCAIGKQAEHFTRTHFGQLVPYNDASPFKKLCDGNGKILMLGTKLSSCSNFHTLEDAVDFNYPVYEKKSVRVQMIDAAGNSCEMTTKVHSPAYSAKRDCNAFKPLFLKEKVLVEGKVGLAESMLIDAHKMHEVMLDQYQKNGVTMYTPFGT